jgi:hypothetical protein
MILPCFDPFSVGISAIFDYQRVRMPNEGFLKWGNPQIISIETYGLGDPPY